MAYRKLNLKNGTTLTAEHLAHMEKGIYDNSVLIEKGGNGGADGISVTHKWNGTVLTITSASGTSSADLKGEKGDTGASPVKGTDYWTEEDKQSIVDEVVAELSEDIPEAGVQFETDETLKLENGVLSVNTADVMEEDNTLPITSAAVFAEVGNINALLGTI